MRLCLDAFRIKARLLTAHSFVRFRSNFSSGRIASSSVYRYLNGHQNPFLQLVVSRTSYYL